MAIRELHQMLKNGQIGTVELTKSYLDKIEKCDKEINSYITVSAEKAIKAAEFAQKKILSGDADLLTGIPLSVKDNICTEGVRTTCASKMLEDFVPVYNAPLFSILSITVAL